MSRNTQRVLVLCQPGRGNAGALSALAAASVTYDHVEGTWGNEQAVFLLIPSEEVAHELAEIMQEEYNTRVLYIDEGQDVLDYTDCRFFWLGRLKPYPAWFQQNGHSLLKHSGRAYFIEFRSNV